MQTDFVPSVRSKFPSGADQRERSLWERDWHVRGEGGGLYVHGPYELLCAGKRPESPYKYSSTSNVDRSTLFSKLIYNRLN